MNKKERIEVLENKMELVIGELFKDHAIMCDDIGNYHSFSSPIENLKLDIQMQRLNENLRLEKRQDDISSLVKELAQLYEMLVALCEHQGVEIVRTAPEPAQWVVEEM